MTRNDLPTYAIVELLMRIARHNKTVGDYKGHRIMGRYVLVTTTGGLVRFSRALIMQQFENPEQINDRALIKQVLASFKTVR